MLYDPSTTPHLKPWLVRTLDPICDAEPNALADYVLALLRHNGPESELRKELSTQLEEFLEKEGPQFIDTLFTVLRTKTYLPYTATSPNQPYSSSSNALSSDSGIPIPLDAILPSTEPTSPERGQKRILEQDGPDGRPAAKGPRLNAEGQFSRYSSASASSPNTRTTGDWGVRQDRSGIANGMMNGGAYDRRYQNYHPPDHRKGICRDYHNSGYCARGAMCKFSHGDDAVIPSQLFPPGMTGALPFFPLFANGSMPFGMGGQAYDPNEAQLDMRSIGLGRQHQHQRTPIISRLQHGDGAQILPASNASGELPVIQDLTPQRSSDAPLVVGQGQGQRSDDVTPNVLPISATVPMDVDTNVSSIHGPSTSENSGRGMPGRGTFPGDAQSFRPERRNDKTLVVEKIPEDKLTLDAVNSWFKRFGTVTNVAIDARSGKALVSFSEHSEAHAAWKSEDAVFGNRFVKVFWHRPMEGHGQRGARMLAASGPLVANMVSKEASLTSSQPSTTTSAAPSTRRTVVPSPAARDLAVKQKLLEQQIAEQKSLMASLESASGQDKKEIMARLRKVGEEMKLSTSPSPSLAVPSPSTALSARVPPQADELERKERERLDKELEMHTSSDTTEQLKAKLAKLKEEAASLGIPEASETAYNVASTHRPYRGRSRGFRGGFHRGGARGVGSRTHMKLDNRPKKLLIKSVPADAVQAVRDWYESAGQVESVEPGEHDEVIVSFRTRASAEQGLAKGQDIPVIGPVQISWYTGPPPESQQSLVGLSGNGVSHDRNDDELHISPDEPGSPSHPPEEEIGASGWRTGEEEGMGIF